MKWWLGALHQLLQVRSEGGQFNILRAVVGKDVMSIEVTALGPGESIIIDLLLSDIRSFVLSTSEDLLKSPLFYFFFYHNFKLYTVNNIVTL